MSKNSQLANEPKVSRVRRAAIGRPFPFMGVAFGTMMFIFFGFIGITHSKSLNQVIVLLLITLLLSSVAGFMFTKNMQKTTKKREKEFDLTLTAQDRVDLFIWLKYGHVPTSHHLQPVLENYLNYLESNVRGKTFVESQKKRIVFSILFGVLSITQLLVVIFDFSLKNLFSLVILSALAFTSIISKPNQSSPVFEFFGAKSLKKIGRMRSQLNRQR